jgi:hypothetical protein
MSIGKTDLTSTRKARATPTFNEEGRYSVVKKNYPWKKTENGCKGLALLYWLTNRYGEDDDHWLHPPKEMNVDLKKITLEMRKLFPKLVDEMDSLGAPLNHSRVKGRFGNMYRENEKKQFSFGAEHPKNCKVVRDELRNIREQLEKTNWEGPIV